MCRKNNITDKGLEFDGCRDVYDDKEWIDIIGNFAATKLQYFQYLPYTHFFIYVDFYRATVCRLSVCLSVRPSGRDVQVP